MKNELMIDIETTGQKPGCKVLSLGAYGFDKDGFPTEFYKRFSIAKQDAEDLDDDHDTMAWWFKQGQDARIQALVLPALFHQPRRPFFGLVLRSRF